MDEEIDLRDLWNIFRKRWKLLIAIPLLAALLVVSVSLLLVKPAYVASTTLMTVKPSDSEKVILQKIVNSSSLLDRLVRELDLPYTGEEMKDRIAFDYGVKTGVIDIEFSDNVPGRAGRISNGLAEMLVAEAAGVEGIEQLEVIDEAGASGKRIGPNLKKNIAVALLLGLLLAAGLVFLQHALDRTIKTAEQIETLLGLSVLGDIPVMEE